MARTAVTRRLGLRIAAILTFSALFLAGEMWLLPALADMRPMCERTGEWAKVHAAEYQKNADYDTFTALPLGYRKALYPLLKEEAKRRLWGEQLQRAIDGGKLTGDQREFLIRVLSDPGWFSKSKLTKDFNDSVQSAFPTSQSKFIFSRLGDAEGRPITLAAAQLMLLEGARARFVAYAMEEPVNLGTCNCASDYSGLLPECPFSGVSCTLGAGGVYYTCDWQGYGCGFFWFYPCDGRCCNGVGACF